MGVWVKGVKMPRLEGVPRWGVNGEEVEEGEVM